MSFVDKNTDFGGRLTALFTRDGYTERGWSEKAARKMYDDELIDLKHEYRGKDAYEDGNAAIARLLSSAANKMREDTKKTSVSEISTQWLERYCIFFDCSAAFLFGEINDPKFQDTDIQKETGLALSAINTLRKYQKEAREKYIMQNPTAAVVSFLLRKDHCMENSGGLLHLIAAYLTSDDFSVAGFDETLHTNGINGSGFELKTADVVRAAIPNMIMQRLEEYRHEVQRKRKK